MEGAQNPTSAMARKDEDMKLKFGEDEFEFNVAKGSPSLPLRLYGRTEDRRTSFAVDCGKTCWMSTLKGSPLKRVTPSALLGQLNETQKKHVREAFDR